MTYHQAIKWAEQKLIQANQPSGFGKRLMLDLCELSGINLYLVIHQVMDKQILVQYQQKVNRLCQNEPLGYVVGKEWFFNRPFTVDSRVLIPREETQELIGQMLLRMDDLFEDNQPLSIVDIGTGSGCCGITLSLEANQPNRLVLTDISPEALQVASENAEQLGVMATLLCGDMAKPLIERTDRFDVIVCNPPYILDSEEVMTSVLDYEPHVALFGGEDGLKFYRSLLDDLSAIAKQTCLVGFEIGYQQREHLLAEIQKRYPLAKVEFAKDINGLDRMCFLTLVN